MQLSEVSELRSIICLMRQNACNSPRFHDRQDSEVDRIYNSSPKVASYEMRSSWMDRPSIQMPAAAASQPTQSVQQSAHTHHEDVSSSHDASGSSFKAKQQPANPNPNPTTDNKQDNKGTDALAGAPNGKPKVVVFDSKKASSNTVDVGGTNGGGEVVAPSHSLLFSRMCCHRLRRSCLRVKTCHPSSSPCKRRCSTWRCAGSAPSTETAAAK